MKILFLFPLLILTAHAESYKIAGDLLEFKNHDGLLVRGCEKSCDALKTVKKYKKIKLSDYREGMTFSNSVGSDVCHKVYKADALLGVAENKDQRAFCFFKDKSFIEMNSLSRYLLEKKIIIE